MATTQEKEALGLDPKANDSEVMDRIDEVMAKFEREDRGAVDKIAVLSMTGQTRPCGTYMVPHDVPLVLDLATVEPRDLGELEADPRILKVRTDTPITAPADVTRFKRA